MNKDVIKRVGTESDLLPTAVRKSWANLCCATCGAPVGPEAAGSTECLDCIAGSKILPA